MKVWVFHVKLTVLLLLLISAHSFAQHFSSTTLVIKELPPVPVQQHGIVQSYSSFDIADSFTPELNDWFYWTNYLRMRPKAFWDSVVSPIINVYPQLNTKYAQSLKKDLYSANHLTGLKPNTQLMTLSQSHASDLAKKNASPSHTSANGRTFQQRMAAAGITNCAGENLSLGSSYNTVLSIVFLAIDEGIPDVGHRKSLLSPVYTQLGIGIDRYKNNNVLVVQDFACDQPK